MTNARKLAPIALTLFGLAGCAADSTASHQAAGGGSVSEIVLGFWHGLIAPITLIGEIIQEVAPNILPWSFSFYESQNTGVLYDVGFFVGLIAIPSILATGSARHRLFVRREAH